MDFKKQYRCPSIAYVKAHDDWNITNHNIDWTQGAIYLVPTGNLQVGGELIKPEI